MQNEFYELIADRLMSTGSFSFKGYRYYLGLEYDGRWQVFKAPLFESGGYDASKAEILFTFEMS